MTAKDVILQTLEAFNNDDIPAAMATYSDAAVVYDPQYPEPLRGHGPIREDLEVFFRAFPDVRFELNSILGDGDTVAFDGTMTGTHKGPMPGPDGEIPATGKSVQIPAALFVRVAAGGKIDEERRYFDVARLLTQLGLMPS